ncbi:hypothetical protein M404DRAFT_26156 [Pisolithus tinctorius Marx 270]|uniref:Uncharacterized protein n=1 Tax=Pisolithus tinctorius Marx 270 TaxID=870435 RepID=A0A0C3K520_PISTI|nr:hypothetical protein M404DRAFT_26156 [Pisolithus tinctorius Marx 270]
MALNMGELGLTAQYMCNCTKYNFSRPHAVSKATFYHHIDEADTEEEKASHCVAILQAMAKRHLEMVEDACGHVGHQKCARSADMGIPPPTLAFLEEDFNHPANKGMPLSLPGPPLNTPANKDMPLHFLDLPEDDFDPLPDKDMPLYFPDLPEDDFDPPPDENLPLHTLHAGCNPPPTQ